MPPITVGETQTMKTQSRSLRDQLPQKQGAPQENGGKGRAKVARTTPAVEEAGVTALPGFAAPQPNQATGRSRRARLTRQEAALGRKRDERGESVTGEPYRPETRAH